MTNKYSVSNGDSIPNQDSMGDKASVREDSSDRCASAEGSLTDGDFSLESYSFYLPEEQIAQHPAPQRGTSRLLVVHKNTAPLQLEEKVFTDILDVLPENCLLVANNSRVVPARLMGKRASGGKVEFLLLSPLPLLTPCTLSLEECQRYGFGAECGGVLDEATQGRQEDFGQSTAGHNSTGNSAETWQYAEAQGLLRSSKQVKIGEVLQFSPDLYVEMLERHDFGRSQVRLLWRGDLHAILDREGSLPLPPYIKRPRTEEGEVQGASGGWGSDGERYQTIYSSESKAGSVAAPTAGLHFTPELRERVMSSGREWVEATLYVGYGTFSPVREDDIRKHVMHAEYVELSATAATAINKAKSEGRPVIPIGTTSVRILEGVYRALYGENVEGVFSACVVEGKEGQAEACVKKADSTASLAQSQALPLGQKLSAYSGWVNLFLYPGETFYLADGLITNFHLPGSSLLMLVSAFAGRENILEAYDYAVKHGFKFFSYGDSMFIY